MKKWITRILITTIVLAIVVISYFVFSSNETGLLNKVPSDATSVVVIDLKGLSAKLVFDELTSDEKNADKLVEMMPDSLIDIDWSKSGINLLDKAVLFTSKKGTSDSIQIYLLLPISNEEDLSKFIDGLATNIKLEIDHKGVIHTAFSTQYRMLVGWNKNFVIATFLSDNQAQGKTTISKILSANGEKSIMNDSAFAKNLKADFDIMAYALSTNPVPEKFGPFIHENIESVSSFIKLDDGVLEIEMLLKQKRDGILNQLFNQTKNEFASLKSSDSCSLNAHFNLNPGAFFKIIAQYSSIKLNMEKIPALLAWDGRANIIVNGSKIIENEYISYDYDDDFNKIEIKKTEHEKIYDIQSLLGLNETILDSIYTKQPVARSKKDTLLFKGSNSILKKSGNVYLSYNKYIDKPVLTPETKQENISLFIKFNSFLQTLKENAFVGDSTIFNKLPLEKIEININKTEEIILKSKFYFIDKQKNALFSIAEKFE